MMDESSRVGAAPATAAALAAVYDDLRRRARRLMRFEPKDHTLEPTALVNEAFLRLARSGATPPTDPSELVRLASLTMRRVLVDRARRARRTKRYGGHRVDLADVALAADGTNVDPIVLDEALRRLEAHDEDLAAVVTLHHYFGMTVAEVARQLCRSEAKVKKDLSFARAWLRRALAEGDSR